MTSTASQPDVPSTPTLDRRFPRTHLVAGYIFDPQTLVPWAQHLIGRQYDPENVDIVTGAFLDVRDIAWRKYGMTMELIGEEVTLESMKYMVVTQIRDFPKGCVGYPEDKLPQFKEGAREARVREVMIKEGFDPSKLHFARKLI